MQGLDRRLGLRRELRDQRPVLNRVVLAHGAADSDASRVHHDNALIEVV